MITASIVDDKNGFELYKKSKLVDTVGKISAEVYGEDYGKTSAKIMDDGDLMMQNKVEIEKLNSGENIVSRGVGGSSTSGT